MLIIMDYFHKSQFQYSCPNFIKNKFMSPPPLFHTTYIRFWKVQNHTGKLSELLSSLIITLAN